MTHTPGTWKWYDSDGNEPATDFSQFGLTLRTVEIYKGEARIIGQARFDLPKFILTIVDDVSEADAKLIAKAPEMAERLAKLEDALLLILPLAKGYAAEHPVGSNQVYVDQAEKVTKEQA